MTTDNSFIVTQARGQLACFDSSGQSINSLFYTDDGEWIIDDVIEMAAGGGINVKFIAWDSEYQRTYIPSVSSGELFVVGYK